MLIKKLIKRNKYLYSFIRFVQRHYYRIMAKRIADKNYRSVFGRRINWKNPIEFNEKIRWLQFYSDTHYWPLLADKYRVREFIKGKGYGDTLVKLHSAWFDDKNIDYNTLPESFVLKSNNGCGDVIVVKDKTSIDLAAIKQYVHKALTSNFGFMSAEPHYSKISPCVIVEEFLENDAIFSNGIVDYKFYCFNGVPRICGVYYDRLPNSHVTNSTFYDMEWRRHDEWKSPTISTKSKDIPKPSLLPQMIEMCRDLADGIPFVRLDLYYVSNKIYFGEFTFTPAACSGGSLNPDIYQELGALICLPPKSH